MKPPGLHAGFWQQPALWWLLERRCPLLDDQEARGDDRRSWTVRACKMPG